MPADPETLLAIQTLGSELRATVEAKLEAHKAHADEARGKIYERIESHARESRQQLSESTAEMRGAVQAVSLQVVAIGTELKAHAVHDDDRFRRIENSLREQESSDKSAATDRWKLWNVIAYLLGALGLTSLGSSIVDKLKGGGQ